MPDSSPPSSPPFNPPLNFGRHILCHFICVDSFLPLLGGCTHALDCLPTCGYVHWYAVLSHMGGMKKHTLETFRNKSLFFLYYYYFVTHFFLFPSCAGVYVCVVAYPRYERTCAGITQCYTVAIWTTVQDSQKKWNCLFLQQNTQPITFLPFQFICLATKPPLCASCILQARVNESAWLTRSAFSKSQINSEREREKIDISILTRFMIDSFHSFTFLFPRLIRVPYHTIPYHTMAGWLL